jgi:hypothetical protein
MANTYTLIQAQTLASSAASVTFSSIPATYTDLVLKCSIREAPLSNQSTDLQIQFNADTTNNYSKTSIEADGATAFSTRQSNLYAQFFLNVTAGSVSTANTFSSFEMYLPNYTSTSNKPLSGFGADENNTTTAYLVGHAGLYRGTSAISLIKIMDPNIGSFDTTSSFYLYGIKNS